MRIVKTLISFVVASNAFGQTDPDSAIAVPMILLTEVSSGGAPQGKEIAFMVTQDVTSADNSIVIPRGAIAYGKVVWSRSAGAISKFLNEPARLAVAIDRTVTADGKTIHLQATNSKEGKPLQFTGENTRVDVASDELKKILADESSKKALQQMLEVFSGSDMGSAGIVAGLAKRLNLSSMFQLAEARSLGDLVSVFKGIAAGQIARVGVGEAGLVIGAITELAGLRRSVGNLISGLFKGRNIRAFPGTPVVAYVRRDP
ncbi:MAG: hypothetical protein M3R13_08760 [Armatimonadota bacterium]|nr:hypothetical protein [Armatimonadota bacterium]